MIRNPKTVVGGDDYIISAEGRRLLDPTRFEAYKGAALLPRAFLHPLVLDAALPDYNRGRYDMAVFAGMRRIEIEIRTVAGLPNTSYGADLAREAFEPKKGPLRDPNATDKEQAAIRDLFVSAMGALGNPTRYRAIEFSDPTEVAQIGH